MSNMRQFSFLLPAATVLLCFAFYFSGGDAARIGVPLCLGASLVTLVFSGRRNTTLNAAPPEESPKESAFPKISQKQVDEETGVVQIAALGSEHRRTQWQNVETKVDEILDDCIKLIRARIDAHTVAVFFPTLDGGFKLRRYSSNCEFINREAVIYPGVGVIGGFLKDGLKQLNLKEIMSDSMTLYYYNKDAGIRSLMASPIIAGGTERGTIIVDSTNKKNFSDEDHAYLALVASLLGQAVFSTYLCTEHKLEHIRLAAMSSI
ncbi:MAG TPA: GAF domain-containing protein [Chitinispirillaceae bacterium]|nr:GAF domain-containing protein [Chitinispirillaceae bacterium]